MERYAATHNAVLYSHNTETYSAPAIIVTINQKKGHRRNDAFTEQLY